MDLDSTRQDLNAIQKSQELAIYAVANRFREEILAPFCRQHRLHFQSGNGTYCFSFYEDEGRPLSERRIKAGYDAFSAEDLVEYGIDSRTVGELLHLDVGNGHNLFEYVDDYDPRKFVPRNVGTTEQILWAVAHDILTRLHQGAITEEQARTEFERRTQRRSTRTPHRTVLADVSGAAPSIADMGLVHLAGSKVGRPTTFACGGAHGSQPEDVPLWTYSVPKVTCPWCMREWKTRNA